MEKGLAADIVKGLAADMKKVRKKIRNKFYTNHCSQFQIRLNYFVHPIYTRIFFFFCNGG